MSTVIKPTVGRVVLYYPPNRPAGSEPVPALIAKVISDDLINVGYFREDGQPDPHPPTNIPLMQEGETPPLNHPSNLAVTGYCTWMPYQLGQAKAQTATSPGTAPAGVSAPLPTVPTSAPAAPLAATK